MPTTTRRFIALFASAATVFVGAHAARYGWDAAHLGAMTIAGSQAILNAIPNGDAR